jgi:UDP-N-acetylglucosamine 4-epimerase
LKELVESIKKVFDKLEIDSSPSKVINGPNRQGDVQHSLADILKAKSLIDYNPIYSFEEGIEQTINWFINNKHNK